MSDDVWNSDSRPLRWPLYNSEYHGAAVDPAQQFLQVQWPTSDEDEEINIVLKLSLSQFTALASAIDAGRDIAFGDKSDAIWVLWLKALQSMTICEDVNNCIQTNASTQAALNDFLENSGVLNPNQASGTDTTGNDRFPAATRESTDVYEPPAGCDLDVLWAGIFEIVTRLDDNARQVLETMNAHADKLQRIGELIEAVPILGSGGDALLKQVSETAPDLLNLFNAYSSIGNMETLACEIFDLVCEECRYPTYEELWQTVASHALGGLTDFGVLNVIVTLGSWITSAAAAATVVWHTTLIVELFVLYMDAKYLNSYGQDAIPLFASLGEDIPSDDWETLCGACGGWCIEFDWTTTDGSFIQRPDLPAGVWNSGQGWQCTLEDFGSGDANYSYPYRDFSTSFTVNNFTIRYKGTAGAANRNLNIAAWNGASLVYVHNFGAYDLSGTEQEVTISPSAMTITRLVVSGITGLGSPLDTDAITLTYFRMQGQGTPPITSNC